MKTEYFSTTVLSLPVPTWEALNKRCRRTGKSSSHENTEVLFLAFSLVSFVFFVSSSFLHIVMWLLLGGGGAYPRFLGQKIVSTFYEDQGDAASHQCIYAPSFSPESSRSRPSDVLGVVTVVKVLGLTHPTKQLAKNTTPASTEPRSKATILKHAPTT